MLRNRKKPAADTSAETLGDAAEPAGATVESGDFFDETLAADRQKEAAAVVQQFADHTTMPQEGEKPEGRTHIANPSSTRREGHAAAVKRKPPSVLSVVAGDAVVQLIDKGSNKDGIGVRIEFPDGRKPTEEERDIIRGVMTEPNGDFPSGFRWKSEFGMWFKEIGADSPGNRSTAIRIDAESRVKRLAEDLAQHQTNPEGFADMVKQRREQAANRDHIPD